MLTKLYDNVLKYFGLRDPHDFKYLLQFVGWSDPQPILHRNAERYEGYQSIVRKALRSNLLGSDAEEIINGYHHPEATLELIIDTVKRADVPQHRIPIDEHYLSAWEYTRQAFAPANKLRPVHLADMRWYDWNWHPNVEEPFYSDKRLRTAVEQAAAAGILPDGRMSFGNLKNVVFVRLRTFMHQIKRGQITDHKVLYPLVNVHVKPALSSPDKFKVRVIAGVSKLHVVPSAQRFWPLFRDWIENGHAPMLWGYETLLGGMSKLNQIMIFTTPSFNSFVTVDWPSYDLGVLYDERSRCYDCYESYFEFEKGYIPTKHYQTSVAEPEHLYNAWNWIKDASRKMPIRFPDGSTYIMKDNVWFVYSGLFPTQSDDSLINHARIITILRSLGFDVNEKTVLIKVQGDDSIIMLVFLIPADQHEAFKQAFIAKAKYYFGPEIRDDKIEIHNTPQQVEVLGYTNDNGYPCRDWKKLLAMLLHPRGSPSVEVLKAKVCGFAYASMYKWPQVTAILKDIWNFLPNVEPAKLRTQRDILLQGESTFEIPTDHFPTINEVTRYLRVPYQRTIEDRESYFPGYTADSHFRSFF